MPTMPLSFATFAPTLAAAQRRATRQTVFKRLLAATALAALAGLGVATPSAHADGLADLKAALAKPQGTSTLSASFEAKIWRRDGEGKDAEETNGSASVQIEEGANGLRMQYSRDTMLRADAEDRAKEKDGKTRTPLAVAMRSLDAGDARGMLWAAPTLSRSLEKVVFKAERSEALNGKPARVLSFELGQDKISEKDRKYVKKFEGTLDVWIDTDGVPLASKQHIEVSGRAFVVITFDSTNDDEITYAMVGERLVATRKEARYKTSGAGEKNEGRTVRTLTVR